MLTFSAFLVSVLLILCCECKKEENSTRIAAGTKAKAGENLDFVVLTVIFQNQAQICGGKSVALKFAFFFEIQNFLLQALWFEINSS